jgi:hypothetical protein
MASRALSASQAVSCETAKNPRCRCRCGGALHGSGRFATEDEARALRDDDPHHAGPVNVVAEKPCGDLDRHGEHIYSHNGEAVRCPGADGELPGQEPFDWAAPATGHLPPGWEPPPIAAMLEQEYSRAPR